MDKREAVRVPVRAQAQCRGAGLVIDGLVEDVSRSGLFLRAPMGLRPGLVAELEVDLPGEEPLQIAAQVVRVEVNPGREGMGLRFVGAPETHRPLANFIMRHHASFGR